MIARSIAATKTAAARLMGCKPADIRRFEVWAAVAFVVVAGRRPTFVSLKAFDRDAIEFRIAGAAQLSDVRDLGGRCYAVTGSRGDKYGVDLALEVCTCPDHHYWLGSQLEGASI